MKISRQLLQIPLFLLGSCAPIQPVTNITITTTNPTEEQIREKRKLANTVEFKKSLIRVNPDSCQGISVEDVEHYIYPPLPDLSKIDPNDKDALADALVDHIELLRGEIGTVLTQVKCNQTK